MMMMLARVTHVEKEDKAMTMARGRDGLVACRLRRLGRGFACGAALVGLVVVQVPVADVS